MTFERLRNEVTRILHNVCANCGIEIPEGHLLCPDCEKDLYDEEDQAEMDKIIGIIND